MTQLQAGDRIKIETWPIPLEVVTVGKYEIVLKNSKSGLIVRAEIGHLTNGRTKYEKV